MTYTNTAKDISALLDHGTIECKLRHHIHPPHCHERSDKKCGMIDCPNHSHITELCEILDIFEEWRKESKENGDLNYNECVETLPSWFQLRWLVETLKESKENGDLNYNECVETLPSWFQLRWLVETLCIRREPPVVQVDERPKLGFLCEESLINDSYGDGLCCSNGSGSYAIK